MRESIFSLVLFPLMLLAQAPDSTSLSFRKIQPAFYFDYGKAIGSLNSESQKWEGGFEIIFFDKIQAIVEMGTWDLQPESAINNGMYQMTGDYRRIGFGYTPHVNPESRIGLGFRYGMARYSDRGSYLIESDSELQPDFEESFNRLGLEATWMEAVFYSDKAVNNWLTLGFNFRVRFIQSFDRPVAPEVMIVPGYGRSLDKAIPALNLFLKIEPF